MTTLHSPFSTGGFAVNLTDFAAILSLQGAVEGSTTFSLYADDSETPGTLIDTLGTIEDSSLTLIPATYTLSGLDIALAAADDSGTGTAGEFLAANQIFPDSDGPLNMSVTGQTDVAPETPEPGTLALMGTGLALALGWRARPNRRTGGL